MIEARSQRTLVGSLVPVSGHSHEHDILEGCMTAYFGRQLIAIEPR
jgi:hypothetical protein